MNCAWQLAETPVDRSVAQQLSTDVAAPAQPEPRGNPVERGAMQTFAGTAPADAGATENPAHATMAEQDNTLHELAGFF